MATKKSSFKINESSISMFLGGLVVLAVGILVYNYFTKINLDKKTKLDLTKQEEAKLTIEEKTEILPKKYNVVAGDHLWKISEKFYQSGYNWLDIAKANKLENPDLIYANQELIIPKVEVKKGDIGTLGEKGVGPDAITTNKYQVIRGDNLWNIAVRGCGDGFKWVNLGKVNGLVNPNLIHAGNVFKITCE